MPFFSIVIPTLNEEKYLPKLLHCLENQLDKDFETIVVDAHSEDKTVEVANKLSGKLPYHTTLISLQRNVSHQRNLGAKRAKGKYLVFFDADTQIPTNFLSQIHHHLLENHNCQLLTTWVIPDSENKSDKIFISITNVLIEAAKSFDKPFMAGFNIIIKKPVFFKIGGFNERLKLAEDHDLAQRLHQKGVELHILKNPKLTMSLRRFRREGTLTILRKYALVTSKILFEGPITEQLFDYPMGGRVPTKQNKSAKTKLRHHLTRIKKYFGSIGSYS